MRRGMLSALFFCAVILHNALAWAASEDKAPPPAPVVVEAVEVMDLAPEADFVGTLHFVRNSAMAAEVAGKVREVGVEVGDRVRRGQVLARLNTDLLDKAILALEMEVEEVDTRLELARKLYERHQELFESGNVAEHTFDDSRLATAGLESRLASRRAELAGRMLEREKRTIQADFDGVVLEKGVEVGEWLPVGGLVVRVADNEVLEVEVPLPQRYLPYLSIGAAVQVTVSGNILQGRIRTIIPQADATSRTVPIRIRLQEDNGLAAGTEALVTLPVGEAIQALVVSRDALVDKGMGPMVVAVQDGAARMVPVRPLVYAGNRVGIESEGLQDGDRVVVKGNERLQPGQPLAVIDTGQ